jgi:hypothetical protein
MQPNLKTVRDRFVDFSTTGDLDSESYSLLSCDVRWLHIPNIRRGDRMADRHIVLSFHTYRSYINTLEHGGQLKTSFNSKF